MLTPNVAREVSLLPQLLPSIPAYTLNRACASAAQAIANAADQITLGHADTIIAGGVESLSDIPILHSRRFSQVLVDASKARSLGARVATFGRVRPRDLVPVTPAIAEPSTGESMGQSAEKMAKENGITREAQDRLALMSHQRAAAATADGRLARRDRALVRRPGDGPGDHRGQRHPGRTPRSRRWPSSGRCSTGGTGRSRRATPRRSPTAPPRCCSWRRKRRGRWATSRWPTSGATPSAAVDPGWQLLMGPVYAVPKALERAGITWSELGLVEIHEAFAAQVLSNVQAWGSHAWADRLGLAGPVGEVDWERTNVMGGSIAIGHPFAATGARLVTTLANEMRPPRRAVRPDLDLRAGRHGIRDGAGAGMSDAATDEAMSAFTTEVRRLPSPSSPSTCPASRSTSSPPR